MKHPDFAERFKQAVIHAGVKNTQKHLAKILGVSEVMIWSYKNGEKLPRMSTALRIAETLNVSIEWLLQGKHSVIAEAPATYHTETATSTTAEMIDLLSKLTEKQRREALMLLKQHFLI
jgi:transcriptional regulator with XRE-family HTH domain